MWSERVVSPLVSFTETDFAALALSATAAFCWTEPLGKNQSPVARAAVEAIMARVAFFILMLVAKKIRTKG
jgi:hypothetical protein